MERVGVGRASLLGPMEQAVVLANPRVLVRWFNIQRLITF